MNNTTQIEIFHSIEDLGRVSSCNNLEHVCERLRNLLSGHAGDFPVLTRATLMNFFSHDGFLSLALDKEGIIIGIGSISFNAQINETTAYIKCVQVHADYADGEMEKEIFTSLVDLALSHQVRCVDVAQPVATLKDICIDFGCRTTETYRCTLSH